MFTETNFTATAAEIARLNGLSEALAVSHLAAIGDTPELDADGLAIVRDAAGAEIGRMRFPAD